MIDQLKADLKENIASVKTLTWDPAILATDPQKMAEAVIAIGRQLKLTVMPTIEAVVDEVAEIDEVVNDMIDQAEDILQHETGKELAAVILGGQILVTKLREIAAADPQIVAACDEWLGKSFKGAALLEEITLDPEDDEDPDEDADPDDDDDDDDDDDKEDA